MFRGCVHTVVGSIARHPWRSLEGGVRVHEVCSSISVLGAYSVRGRRSLTFVEGCVRSHLPVEVASFHSWVAVPVDVCSVVVREWNTP